jgi:hypothetical protein
MSEQGRTEADRLRSAEVTLATIRQHAESALKLSKAAGIENPLPQARGYDRAMRTVLAILDARWLPEGEPVVLNPDD